MPEIKKYGAFAGVFTPSLLTILGVIMYMRLGWVVGEAGLIYTIGIILFAHVISITTGLSISSIATDKKIKTGGIYYMLSRSLGLPMGGAIGIALFIGTALSISLYIIGFAENFLSIEFIQNFTGLGQDINSFRIIGTITIIALSIIAFISTSLAMRMQFYILIAIGISLISIFVGFFIHGEYHPETINLFGSGDTNLELVFAIFFPAVTGFTAGVAMSGDLRNPKGDIPKGTILSILVGLIIYIILAIAIALYIDPKYLLNDYNILSKIAWFAPLVIAGIWGATLSSALGGILGGPRILQAISLDKIAPKIFGKGYGETNEPRNALLLIFAIAEGGILIGELDVIAKIVSMFYLASYGFINLAYVLEKWASTDFRPSFKIHISLGIIGFLASFAIMFKLDTSSMFASLLIMGSIYLLLKRKQIKSEYGDVWQSVWTSVMRRALQKMSEKEIEERNWKPNIILFSGQTDRRPHLLEFGKCLVGKHGMLSNFDLVENTELDVLFSKQNQAINTEENIPGVFTRRQSCKDIYDGIEMIARTYGFSGVEPNTILIGLGERRDKAERFVKLINTLYNLDYNLLLMDYDKARGFGEKKQIDIWAKDAENYGNFALIISKFLTNHKIWENAKIRFLVVNNSNANAASIKKIAEKHLDKLRIDAEIIVVNNEIEKKSFYEIITTESYHSDLVFVGIPEIEKGKEKEYIEKTSKLFNDIGTVILVKASTVFKQLQLKMTDSKTNENDKIEPIIKKIIDDKDFILPNNKTLAKEQSSLYQKLLDNYNKSLNAFFTKLTNIDASSIENIRELTDNSLNAIKTHYSKFDVSKQKFLINQNQNKLLLKTNKLIESYIKDSSPELKEFFKTSLDSFIQDNQKILNELPKKIKITYNTDDLKANDSDKLSEKLFKARKRLFKNHKYKVRYQELVKTKIEFQTYKNTHKYISDFGMLNVQLIVEYQKIIEEINKIFILLSAKAESKELNDDFINEQQNNLLFKIDEVYTFAKNINTSLSDSFYVNTKNNLNKISTRLNQVNCNKYVVELNHNKKINILKKSFKNTSETWMNNNVLLNNALSTELRLFALDSRVKTFLEDFVFKINLQIKNSLIQEFENFYNYIKSVNNNINENLKSFENKFDEQAFENLIYSIGEQQEYLIKALNKASSNFPEKIEVIDLVELNQFERIQLEGAKAIKISASRLVEYLFLNKLENPLTKEFNELKNRLEQSYEFLTDTRRLIEFSISDYDSNINKSNQNKEIVELINDKVTKVSTELNYLKEISDNINNISKALLSEISHELKYYTFVNTASNLKQYISKQEVKKKKRIFTTKFINLKKLYSEQLSRLIFAKSKAINLKNEIEDKETLLYSNVNAILNIKNSLSPKQEIFNTIPLYYRQLFSNKNSYHKEFWIGRQNELENAKNSIERYYNGSKGAIAIIGEHGSGKTFFTNYISKNYSNKTIYNISPPVSGTTNIKDFERVLENTLLENGSTTDLMKKFEKDSIIILDDFELWWEKSKDGNNLVEHLFSLINQYNKRFLFIISLNYHSAELIFKLNPIKDIFINIIKLNSLGSETIKDIILLRHKSSGLELNYKDKKLSEKNRITLAKLFSRYYKYSAGNVNSALNLWLSNINKYENNTIFVDFKTVDTFDLNRLNTEDLLYLTQFVIHKNITQTKLARIMHSDKNITSQKIKFLLRTGLISKQNKVYTISKYMMASILKILKEKGIL